MRKLTKLPSLMKGHILSLERNLELKFPLYFKEFMIEYGDYSVVENTYIDKNGLSWKISKFWNYPNIYGLIREFMDNGFGKKVAFAHDEGGWSFCLCLDENDYDSVYIYRFTDHLPEEAFLKIADSFEEFIDSLQPEEVIS